MLKTLGTRVVYEKKHGYTLIHFISKITEVKFKLNINKQNLFNRHISVPL